MRVQAGLEPSDAMSALIRESANTLQRPVSGWIAEVTDIDDMEAYRRHCPDEYRLHHQSL